MAGTCFVPEVGARLFDLSRRRTDRCPACSIHVWRMKAMYDAMSIPNTHNATCACLHATVAARRCLVATAAAPCRCAPYAQVLEKQPNGKSKPRSFGHSLCHSVPTKLGHELTA